MSRPNERLLGYCREWSVTDRTHVQAQAGMSSGEFVGGLDIGRETVRFG